MWILGMAEELIRAVRRAERISGVRVGGGDSLMMLGMGIFSCGAIVLLNVGESFFEYFFFLGLS